MNLIDFGRALEIVDETLQGCENALPSLDDQGDTALLRQISLLSAEAAVRAERVKVQLQTRLLGKVTG